MKNINIFKNLFTFFGLVFSIAFPQKDNVDLTVGWIHSERAKSIANVQQHIWLENNTAILYDNRIPIEERLSLIHI